jgi:hypothetical protein
MALSALRMQLSITSDLEVIEGEGRCFERRAECTTN